MRAPRRHSSIIFIPTHFRTNEPDALAKRPSKIVSWWGVSKACAESYLLPQSRTRCFLRGIRKIYAPAGMPDPLAPFGSRRLIDFLAEGVPPTPRSTFTSHVQSNLRYYDLKIHHMHVAGQLPADAPVVISVDRTPGRTFKACISIDKSFTLTTQNAFLMILSASDYGKPDHERRFFRLMLPQERFALQGMSGEDAMLVPPGKRVKASGNAYPSTLLGAMVAPLLGCLAELGDEVYDCSPCEDMENKFSFDRLQSLVQRELRHQMKAKPTGRKTGVPKVKARAKHVKAPKAKASKKSGKAGSSL